MSSHTDPALPALDILGLPVYTLVLRADGTANQGSDPRGGMIAGKCADIGKVKQDFGFATLTCESKKTSRAVRSMPTMLPRYADGISRNTVLLAFASLFSDISSEMLYPILPIFLTQVLHASGSVVGAVEGIAEATQNVVQGLSGWLSDKLHKRKALALIGYFVSALGKPLMGIATAWPGVLGGRFLDRLGAGFRSAPRDALIASSVSDEYRGRAFGLEGIGDNLGAFLGPLLAVLLFLSFHFTLARDVKERPTWIWH